MVHRYLRSGLMAAGVAAALALMVLGFYASDSGDDAPLPEEVERIVPTRGALISPQGDVGADLADTFEGALRIDGAEIPLDQLTVVEATGQLFFNPGAGKDIERFTPGVHSASVIYWPQGESRDEASSFTWQFRVGS